MSLLGKRVVDILKPPAITHSLLGQVKHHATYVAASQEWLSFMFLKIATDDLSMAQPSG